MVWPGSAMTRLTRSVPAGPPQWSRGGWVNTTMSPSRNWCQLKNAFCTRIRSRASSAGTMEVLGIEKTWNTNVRMPNASSSAGARQMAHPAKTRRRDGDASRAASGPPAARPGVPSRRSVAFDQMSAAVGQLVRVRPEVGDPGDQAVVAELEEAQAGLGALRPAELDPARGVPARTDDPLDRDVPGVVEALPVEPEVGLPATHLFPGLRAAVEHIVGDQRAERVPVPGLRRGPVGRDYVVCLGHALARYSPGPTLPPAAPPSPSTSPVRAYGPLTGTTSASPWTATAPAT